MPIASGAAGRVDVGVDSSIAWTPDGLKRKSKPPSRNCDSYLTRYLEMTKGQNSSSNVSQDKGLPYPCDREGTGAENDESAEKSEGSEDDASDEPSTAERSKKSRLCVLL